MLSFFVLCCVVLCCVVLCCDQFAVRSSHCNLLFAVTTNATAHFTMLHVSVFVTRHCKCFDLTGRPQADDLKYWLH